MSARLLRVLAIDRKRNIEGVESPSADVLRLVPKGRFTHGNYTSRISFRIIMCPSSNDGLLLRYPKSLLGAVAIG